MTVQREASASVFAIGNAHIDPVWIWDWREGMREVVATFTAAADRLDNCEDIFFTASSAAYYVWANKWTRHFSSGSKSMCVPGDGTSWAESGSSPTATCHRARPFAANCSTASATSRRLLEPPLPLVTTSIPSATPVRCRSY